jgi:hypothetical protein
MGKRCLYSVVAAPLTEALEGRGVAPLDHGGM